MTKVPVHEEKSEKKREEFLLCIPDSTNQHPFIASVNVSAPWTVFAAFSTGNPLDNSTTSVPLLIPV